MSDNSSTDIVIIDGNSGNITTGDNAGGTNTAPGSDADISIDIIEDEQVIY